MKSDEVTDLKQELVGLFDKENVVAFFDFQLAVDQNESVQGLCKISGPKEGETKSNYLSLLFIIDAPNDAAETKVDKLIRNISWSGLETRLDGTRMVIPMPHVGYDTRHYFKGVEIYLAPEIRVDRSYIADKLYPAISGILGCMANEIIFWEELPSEKKRLEAADVKNNADRTLIEQVIDYFRGA